MESSEEAVLDLFRIGPTTTYGRVVALRVLFCNHFQQLLLFLRSRAVDRFMQLEKLLMFVVGGIRKLVNPRSPNFLLGSMLLAALLLRRYRMRSMKAEVAMRKKFWSNLMKSATTYDEWAHAAAMVDKYNGRKQDSDLYDEELVREKLEELRHRRLEGGVDEIAFALRTDLVRNLGNMCNPELHKGRLQTPRVIQEYINEVRYHLRAVVETHSEEFSLEEKLAFIHETRHAFGRTALLLSGGAALGAFHLGVVRTLIEHKLLPRVIAGASVGSIICSFAATRTWNELQSFFDDPMPPMHFFEEMGSIVATAHRLLTRGAIHEIGLLQRKMRQLIGDLTFQEAYDLSGRVLGIPVSSMRRHEPPRLLNYLTSPHVVIWSAVTASCAFPGLFEAQELMAKDRLGRLVPYHVPAQVGPETPSPVGKRHWRDGSLDCDLPIKELKELFNVNHYIVAQANPHIAPLLRIKEAFRVWGGDTAAKLAHLAEMEVKHRCNQALEMGWRFGGLAKLFAQDWEGDVTIVMPATVAQFAKLITNPTPPELRKAVMQGRRCTWAKLSAIQANCGIELMLDECVSELNRRRKLAKEAERHGDNSKSGRFTLGTKRIPSWNCMARESSWGSLDEDGMQDAIQNGPWAGPMYAYRRNKFSRGNHDGSDSDSGTDNAELNQLSWTKAGGPLMRTASAARLALLGLQGEDHAGDGVDQVEGASGFKGDDGGDGDTPRSLSGRLGRSGSGVPVDTRPSLRSRIWLGITSPVSPAGPMSFLPSLSVDSQIRLDDQEESDAEDRSFGLAMRSGMRRSPRSSAEVLDSHLDRHTMSGERQGSGQLDKTEVGDGDDDTVRGGKKASALLKASLGRGNSGKDSNQSGGSVPAGTHEDAQREPEGQFIMRDSFPPRRGLYTTTGVKSEHHQQCLIPKTQFVSSSVDSPGSVNSLKHLGAENQLREMLTSKMQSENDANRSKSMGRCNSDVGKVGPFGSFVSRASSLAGDSELREADSI